MSIVRNGALKPTNFDVYLLECATTFVVIVNQNKTTSTSYKIQQHSKYQNLLFQSGADTVLEHQFSECQGGFS